MPNNYNSTELKMNFNNALRRFKNQNLENLSETETLNPTGEIINAEGLE